MSATHRLRVSGGARAGETHELVPGRVFVIGRGKEADLRFPDDKKFVGLDNYGAVLTDQYWWTALAGTAGLTVVSFGAEGQPNTLLFLM